jgi:hypothetical protein
MATAEYQIVTLKRALGRHGVVCRVRSERGGVRVDVFWMPPRVKRAMRPFVSAMPLTLMQDLVGHGFTSLDEVPIDGLFKTGIVAASFASTATEAAASARAVIESHGLANSDRLVAWAPTPAANGIRVNRHAADKMVAAPAR